jgi:hypothetical protein
MSNSVFTNWTSAARHLNEKIKNNSLIAGRGIKLENTGNGIRIHSLANNPPGDSYKGYFKVIQTAANKIKIVDGFADDYTTATTAGDALINDTIFENIAVQEFTITADSFIYLIVEPFWDEYTAIIQIFASKQDYESGKSKTLISRVKFADSKITKASQEVHGVILGNIDGDCDS